MGGKRQPRISVSEKTCSKCLKTYSISCFTKRTGALDGHQGQCKFCAAEKRAKNAPIYKERRRIKYEQDPHTRKVYLDYHKKRYAREKDKMKEYQRQHYSVPRNKIKYLLTSAKARCRKSGVPFNISVDDIEIPKYCPILEVELSYLHKKGRLETTASIDRIIPSLGYVPGNVRVVCDLANRIKTNATKEQLLTFAKNIKGYLE